MGYRITFAIKERGLQTVVTETVALDAEPLKGLPLQLLAPITKRAFKKKLTQLASMAERSTDASAQEGQR